MNFLLLLYPIQIIVFITLNVLLVITSLVLAAKNEIRFHFLIWTLLIVFLPLLGGISYLIKYYTLNTKTNNSIS